MEISQSIEVHEARVRKTAEQSSIIASFRTSVPPVFAVPKESRDSIEPLLGLKNQDNWNPHDSVHGLFTRENKSLKVHKKKLHAEISRGFSGHSEAESLAYYLLDASNLCW